jgi:hypothetical protein
MTYTTHLLDPTEVVLDSGRPKHLIDHLRFLLAVAAFAIGGVTVNGCNAPE